MCKDRFFQSDGIAVYKLGDVVDQDRGEVFFAHPELAGDDLGYDFELDDKVLVRLWTQN